MAIVYVAPTARGLADGTSPDNAMSWASMNAAIGTAAVGGPSREVRMLTDYGAYVHTTTGQVATINAAPTSWVEVFGWSHAGQRKDYARLVSNRAHPFVPPAPNNEDVWVPPGSDGSVGLIAYNLAAGSKNITWSYLAPHRMQGLFRVTGALGPMRWSNIAGTECRWILMVDSGGIKGTSTQHAVIENVSLRGFTKYVCRLISSSYVDIRNVTGDSQGQWGDGFTVGIALGGNTANTANDHITIDGFEFANCHGWDYLVTTQKWTFSPGASVPTAGTFMVSVDGGEPVSLPFNATPAQVKQALATAGASAGLSLRSVFVSGSALPSGTLSVSIGGERFHLSPPSVSWDFSGLSGGTINLATRPWAAPQPGYFQGDGITTEEFDRQIVIRNGRVLNVGDGGLDLKSSDTLVTNVRCYEAKRSFRVHPPDSANKGLPVVLKNCVSRDVKTPTYPVGWPLAGQTAPGSKSAVQANGNVIVTGLDHADDSAQTNVFHAESGGRITALDARVRRAVGSELAHIEGLSFIERHEISDIVT